MYSTMTVVNYTVYLEVAKRVDLKKQKNANLGFRIIEIFSLAFCSPHILSTSPAPNMNVQDSAVVKHGM